MNTVAEVTPAPSVGAVRHGQPWTPEDLELLTAHHAAGEDPTHIARRLDRTERSVRFKLHQLGLAPFPADQVVPRPRPQPQPVAERTYSVEEIRRTHPRAYRRWTPEEDTRLAERHEQGASLSDVVAEFGRNEGAITSRLATLGLDTSPGLSPEEREG
ncbi:SANT/Myb-like DNA-binding domain-containing protein [Streptomyces sp. NPDC014870]|uniref:SANT/Myb-like DNA-binding domain-containing protein n=1 Tax=Streptomyces sp. NPDC014870 TaxID=3364925 RepID=UPI0036FC89CC